MDNGKQVPVVLGTLHLIPLTWAKHVKPVKLCKHMNIKFNFFFLLVDAPTQVVDTVSQYHEASRSRNLFLSPCCPQKLSGLQSAIQQS